LTGSHRPAQVVGSFFGATISLRPVASRPDLARSVAFHEQPLFSPSGGRNGNPQDGTPATESVTVKVLDLIRFGRHRESESPPTL
jgi:hypothetical protein